MTENAARIFNSGARPLVMAYIGNDDPNRGDSRGASGLAQFIAERIGGDYVYVDRPLLEKFFPLLSLRDQFHAFTKKCGTPDIIMGPQAGELATFTDACLETSYNEHLLYSAPSVKTERLVAHNLTPALLAFERAKFRNHYPQIEGPLIAVMMGGNIYDYHDFTLNLLKLASAYPKATFFVCPSHRTEGRKNFLLSKIESYLDYFEKIHDGQHPKSPFPGSPPRLQNAHLIRQKMRLLHVDYGLAGYNPYLGLLASADHIIVAGESRSLVSEALFAGKIAYLVNPAAEEGYASFHQKGYVQNLDDINCLKPLPVCSIPSQSQIAAIAERILDKYRGHCRRKQSPAPEAMP